MAYDHVRPDPFAGSRAVQTQLSLARCLLGAHWATPTVEPDSIDWPAVVRAACDAWLGGLLLRAVERQTWTLPLPQMQQLRWQAHQISQNNSRMTRPLGRIIGALRRDGLDVLLLKGAALNLTVYERPDLRAMADVDLMVRPEHATRARQVLLTAGCRAGRDQVRDDFFPRYYYEVEVPTSDPAPLRIDLHARPLRPLRYARTIPDDAFWHDAQAADIPGADALIPSAENMLIHLAGHAALHGGYRLRWLYDLQRFVQSDATRIDWDAVVRRSRDWQLSLPVRVGLERAEHVFGPTIPPDAMAALQEAPAGMFDRLTLWHAPRDEHHPVGHILVNLLCTPGLRYRAGYLAAMLLPGPRHMASIYRRRHTGWLACAHLYRWTRAMLRPFTAHLA